MNTHYMEIDSKQNEEHVVWTDNSFTNNTKTRAVIEAYELDGMIYIDELEGAKKFFLHVATGETVINGQRKA